MKTIQIGFYKNDGLINDRLISWWTYGPFVHTDITLDNITYSASGIKNKVIKFNKHTNKDIADLFIDLTITNIEYKCIKTFLNLCVDDKYDKIGILGFILPIKDRTNRWFCSELVSNAFKIIGKEDFMKLEPNRISPNLLYSILTGKKLIKYNRLFNITNLFKKY